jgi:hypothetical protein
VGLPTVAMGILGALMPPVEAAPLLVLPSLVTNLGQLLTGPRLWVLKLSAAPGGAGTAGQVGVVTGAPAGRGKVVYKVGGITFLMSQT